MIGSSSASLHGLACASMLTAVLTVASAAMALVREPSNGAELQTELDNAALGDEIIHDANVESTTPVRLVIVRLR